MDKSLIRLSDNFIAEDNNFAVVSGVEPVCGTVVSLVLASVSQLGYTKAELGRLVVCEAS